MNVLTKTECIFWIVGILAWVFDGKGFAATDIERFVLENENLCFNNIVSGNPEIISLHYKNNSNIFYWVNTGEMNILDKSFQGRIYVDRNSSLCFRNISRDDAGEYVLEQEHPPGNKTIKINVYNGPKQVNIYPRESHIEIGINSGLILNCSAECFKACNFSWWKNDEYEVSTAKTLLFKNVTKEDSGTYACKVYNFANDSALSESESVDLNVLYGTNIINTFPKNTSTMVIENAGISFGCVFESSPPPNVTWIFQNNNSLILTDYNEYASNMSINNAHCCDSGIYTCKGFNGIGEEVEKNFSLNVACKPTFEDSQEIHNISLLADLGNRFMYNVYVIANPGPNATSSSTLNCTFKTIMGSLCLHSLTISFPDLQESDLKEHVISIQNGQGEAKLFLNIKQRASSYEIHTVIGCIFAVASVFLFIFCIVREKDRIKARFIVERRRTEQNLISATDQSASTYRDNILYESSGPIASAEIISEDVRRENVTYQYGSREDLIDEIEGAAANSPVQNNELRRHRLTKKPVPKPRTDTPKQKHRKRSQLNYIEVDFAPTGNGDFHIHGLDNKTNYIQVHIIPKNENRTTTDVKENVVDENADADISQHEYH